MQYALQSLSDGTTRLVDANGDPLGSADADRPILHVLPRLYVPADVLPSSAASLDGLACGDVSLSVKSSLPGAVVPDGGIVIRQPYPNRRYFVGGSHWIRNGWIVPLPLEASEFDIEMCWHVRSPALRRVMDGDEWTLRHLLQVKLLPGEGITYSMDSSCWPQKRDTAPQRTRLVALAATCAQRDNVLEERIEIPGIPLDQAYSIDGFQDEQIHEVSQATTVTQHLDAHRANGPIEMPPSLLAQAVQLARQIPFDPDSDFAKSVAGVPGGMEHHPALTLLCKWWQTARPPEEPFLPGSAMPMVRVQDDGSYWSAYYEIPNAPVVGFNPSGRDCARIGDLVLVLFQAQQASARFDGDGMHIALPSGEPYNTICIDRSQYESGEYDEAWYCLTGLAAFPSRFPAAWKFLCKERDAGGQANLGEPQGSKDSE